MKTRVIIRQQVHDYLSTLAPVPRRKLWAGIKALADSKGDVLQLEGSLHPYWRLRVGRTRVVFQETSHAGERVLVCFFAASRPTVYKIMEQMISSGLLDEFK